MVGDRDSIQVLLRRDFPTGHGPGERSGFIPESGMKARPAMGLNFQSAKDRLQEVHVLKEKTSERFGQTHPSFRPYKIPTLPLPVESR